MIHSNPHTQIPAIDALNNSNVICSINGSLQPSIRVVKMNSLNNMNGMVPLSELLASSSTYSSSATSANTDTITATHIINNIAGFCKKDTAWMLRKIVTDGRRNKFP